MRCETEDLLFDCRLLEVSGRLRYERGISRVVEVVVILATIDV